MNQKENKKYIQSVERALNILNLIAENGEMKLNEVSNITSLKPTTALGLMQTLEHMGYLTRSSSGLAYTLGINSFKLGISYNRNGKLTEDIHTILKTLVNEVEETAYFEISVGDKYYYYDVVMSKLPLRVCPDEDLFITLPDNSAVTKIFRGWKNGLKYATDLEEVEKGLNCFAVPFFSNGNMIGCIALTGPSNRFSADKMEATYQTYRTILGVLDLKQYLNE